MPHLRGQVVWVAALAVVLASCGAAEEPPKALSYGQDGVHSILPLGERTVLTLGFVARNRSDEQVVIESVQPVRTVSAKVTEVAVVGTPREYGELASQVGWPPPDEGNWPPGSLRSLPDSVTLEPSADSAEWGVNVLLKVEVESAFALVEQYRVEGTVGGRRFSDVVDARTAICTDAEVASPECERFAKAHDIVV